MKPFIAAVLAIAFCVSLVFESAVLASGSIAVLSSSEEPTFSDAASAFAKYVNLPVQNFSLHGDFGNAAAVVPALLASEPRFILALGAKAAVAAKAWTRERQEIPVLFAMVLDWKRYDLLDGQHNIMGIASELSPAGYLANMTMLSPSVRRIGVIHGASFNRSLIHQARHDAEQAGLELIVDTIDNPEEFILAFKMMEERLDGYWQIQDPIVFTPENTAWFTERCVKHRIICLGASENMSAVGLLFGLGRSSSEIGAQAAVMAKRILEGHQQPEVYGVVDPFAHSLSLNLKTARTMGMPLDSQTIARYNEDLSLWQRPVDKTFDDQP